MNDELANKTDTLLTKTKEMENGTKERLSELKKQCDRLFEAASGLLNSWSGSWFGYHSELYYGDFEKPPLQNRFDPEWGGFHGIPLGWQSRNAEEVKKRIEDL